MTTMIISKRRTRFGKIGPGEYFQWGNIQPMYKKLDEEHAARMYPEHMFKRYVFAEKCLVYRVKFNQE